MKKFILAIACVFALGTSLSAQNPDKKQCCKKEAQGKEAAKCDKKDGAKKECCKKDAKSECSKK